MKTFVAFFEIPAVNMERAVQFYGTVFGEKLGGVRLPLSATLALAVAVAFS